MLALLVFLLGENTFVYEGETNPVLAVLALLVFLEGENTFVYADAVLVVVLRSRCLR